MFLYAFDLIELNGDDLRRDQLQVRKATPSTLAKAGPGIRFNEHLECDDGEIVFRHACKMGLEGIVSKRRDFTYRSRQIIRLAQDKEPGVCGGEARGRRGLGAVKRRFWRRPDAGQREAPVVPDAIDPQQT